jgi:hypothetical protein
MATSRNTSEGFSDSDQQWFDRLSGKPGLVSDAQAVHEADALKLALELEQDAAEADPELTAAISKDALQHQWEQLQFRAKREGLLRTPQTRWRQRWPAMAGLAAVVALSAVLLPMLNRDNDTAYDPPPVMRGEYVTRQARVSQPVKAAEAFAAALRGAGLKPGIYRRDKTFVVDVDLTPEQLAAAAPAFKLLKFEPTPGFTRVEFDAL